MMTKRANGIVLLGFMVLFSCSSNQEKAKDDTIWNNEDAALTGKQLSMKYCQSCHLYPEPSTLDKTTWERSILPLMGRLRSEEHTSELQSRPHLVCRLLLEKKK